MVVNTEIKDKPLVRWTFGSVLREEGYRCLEASIQQFLSIYEDRFSYYVCYNNCNVSKLKRITSKFPVTLVFQNWATCPVPHRYDPICGRDGAKFGGSMWKWCPPRLNMPQHEIFLDNDVVLIKAMDEIEEFLSSDRPMIDLDTMAFHGRYSNRFNVGEMYNAGFSGLPPNFDVGEMIKKIWEEEGSPSKISNADEQGMIALAMKSKDPILLNGVIKVQSEGAPRDVEYNEDKQPTKIGSYEEIDYKTSSASAYHFVGINRTEHEHWRRFSEHQGYATPKLIL